jgi:hypothetical protein
LYLGFSPVFLDCPFLIVPWVFSSIPGLSLLDCKKTQGTIKKGQSRNTGENPRYNQVGTILEHWRKPKVHSRRDNPGKLEKTQGTMKKGQSRNTGENPRYNEEGTIQENSEIA